jgi:hypothetical protein
MLSVLLPKMSNLLVSGRTLLKLFWLEPDEIPRCFFYPQVETFHGPILRAGDQQKGVRGVKANFVDGSSVVVEDVLLFRSGWLIEIPYNHGTVCGCCCQDAVCNATRGI